MEQVEATKSTKAKPAVSLNANLRVRRETKRRIQAELAKLNKKSFGRKVQMDELLLKVLGLLTPELLTELQEATLSNADRLERQYADFVKRHGVITKDAFLGKLLAGETQRESAVERSKPTTPERA